MFNTYIMPLTRSLYREDELIAALKWSIIKGRFTEALFWSQEALDSNMTPEFLKALLWVWFFACGPASISWMERFEACVKDPNERVCLNLVICLLYNVKLRGDSSTLALLALGLCSYKKEPNTTTLSSVPVGLPNTPVIRALVQGKVDLAWMLLRPDWTKTSWTTLMNVCSIKHPKYMNYIKMLMNPVSWMGDTYTNEYTWHLRALATILTCTTGTLDLHEDVSAYTKILDEHHPHTNLSMRNRRLYEIPYGCLYWFTARGAKRVDETTEYELMIDLEDTLVGSKYWTPYLPIGYDFERENFFHTHFPDDIPDEWSTASRMKSHGYGGVPTGNNINHSVMFNRCLIRWFGLIPCRYIWRGLEIAVEEFTQRWNRCIPKTLEAGIYQAYEEADIELWIHEMDSWSLTSKKRRFVSVI